MEKWALVTGASGGIGKDISRLFAADKINLVLVARNKNKLEENKREFEKTYGIKTEIFSCDLSEPHSPEKIYEYTRNKSLIIKYLINNAGFGKYGDFIKQDFSVYEKMIELNIKSLAGLTHLYARDMVSQREGRIMNIASTAAFQPVPLLNVYASTKSFILNFSEALRNELKGTGVSVSVLCPGETRTSFHKTAGFPESKFKKSHLMESKEVAEIGYKGMMRGKALIIPGLFNKLLTFSSRLAPRRVVPGISRFVIEKIKI